MENVITVCGALGAWLLVAGPLYQAALELREQEIDHDAINATTKSVAKPERLNPWWWLLPPVAWIKQARRSRDYRRAMMDALSENQVAQTVSFLNKANAWGIVALGAFLIAVKETWESVELFHWWVGVFWILIVVIPIICFANAGVRISQSDKMVKREWTAGQGQPAPAEKRS